VVSSRPSPTQKSCQKVKELLVRFWRKKDRSIPAASSSRTPP